MLETKAIQEQSKTLEGAEREDMVNEALTKVECCENFANAAQDLELIAKATALMATIQFEQ